MTARDVAKVVGQVLACKLSHGLVCKLRSRYLTRCLIPASSARNYSIRVAIQGRALAELDFWIENLRTIAPQPVQSHTRRADYVIDCDAPDSALASIAMRAPDNDVCGLEIRRMFTARERRWSSTL